VDVDYVLPAADIAATVMRLTGNHQPRPIGNGERVMPRHDGEDELEPQLPSEQSPVSEMEQRFGAASSLTCPECGGALWAIEEGRLERYQCHTGHQYAPDALESEQRDAVDGALWSAVRVLEEHSALKQRMAKRAADNGLHAVSDGFAEGARDAHEQARRIRSLFFSPEAALGSEKPARKRRSGVARRTAKARTRGRKKARAKRRD